MPPPTRPRIVVTRRLPAPVERELAARFDVVLNQMDRPMDADALRAALQDADGVVPTVTDRLDASVLGVTPLRAGILANFGVGVNHIDLESAHREGIVVTNTPSVLTDATADLTLALILMTVRRLGEGERVVRAGQWSGWAPTHLLGRDLGGLTLGIVGMGRIGRAVARRAHQGFGMRVRYWGPRPVETELLDGTGAEPCIHLVDLLSSVDVVSLHCPAKPDTRHLMDAAALAAMRPGSWLVNTARGDVVETGALVDALRSRHLTAVGLDVYEGEPDVPAALRALEQVVLLPHLGSATVETRVAMGEKVIANLTAFFDGRRCPDLCEA